MINKNSSTYLHETSFFKNIELITLIIKVTRENNLNLTIIKTRI